MIFGQRERHHGKFGSMNLNNIFNGIFNGKTILITGHTGFLGSWLTLWLKLLNTNIVGYSLEPPTDPSLFETLDLKNDIIHVVADIRNKDLLFKTIEEHKPEFIFHLAAQSLVSKSYERPLETFETNIIGTANVCESVRCFPQVQACLIMTSDKCYDNTNRRIHVESDPMGGIDPYSASKGASELVISAYRNSFFDDKSSPSKIATIRAGNMIGGGDWAQDRLIPDCIRNLMQNNPIPLRNPDFVRPWQYILEPISGMLWLACNMYSNPSKFSVPWNFGPTNHKNSIKVRELVEILLKNWNSGKWIDISNNKSEDMYESESLLIDSSKAKQLLGWYTIYSIDESVTATTLWYNAFVKKITDMKKFTISQIENYVQKAQQNNLIWSL